jgi:Na+/H+-translocating membrane pyrophosphatase
LYKLDRSHKALLLLASGVLKSFLMSIVSSYVFCGSINPYVLFFHCISNVAFVGVSIAAVALIGAFFGYYIIKLKPFDSIFPNLMMGDFIVTAMYFGASFTAPSIIAQK